MGSDHTGRTFISYSRKDGADKASWLRTWLEARDLKVWQDIVALEGGRDWWSQIEDALKSNTLQHFIMVLTPAALASPVVRREIRLARQEGKTVCPVKGPGLADLGGLPRWLGQIYDLDLTEHQTTLIRVLQAESRQKRVPMMAPEPPEDFVQRPKEFDALKKQLLDAKGDAIAGITAALRGAGGYGKTTLAKALAHDPDIEDAYFDGILWAELGEPELGEKPERQRLLSILTDQIEVLMGERPGLETINAAAGKLGEALGDRRILLIVDDVWREQDLKPFLQGGPRCVRLVTTRIDSALPSTALRQKVDAMQAGEALSLLSAGLPLDETARERANLMKLAARLGEWAQLLKIVNGFLRDRVVRAHEPLSMAIADANKRLDAKGLVVFDARDDADRAKAVARTIGVSLDLLSEAERARFSELGVFPEDAEVPVGVVSRLWAATGGLADFETEDLLSRLHDLSLLLELDLGQRFFRLHDTIRHFLRDRAGNDGLVAQYRRLVAALDGAANAETDARTRNATWQRSLEISYDEMGDFLQTQPDYTGALELYNASLDIAKKLAQLDSNNMEWQRDVELGYDNVGSVKEEQDDLDGALVCYLASLKIADRLVKSDPSNTKWQRDLAMAFRQLAKVKQKQQDYTGALELYDASLDIAKKLAQLDSNNMEWQRGVELVYDNVGSVKEEQDDLDGALVCYLESLEIADRLAKSDPSNTKWQRELAMAFRQLAKVQLKLVHKQSGDKTKAGDYLRQGRENMARLTSLGSDNEKDLAWFEETILELANPAPHS